MKNKGAIQVKMGGRSCLELQRGQVREINNNNNKEVNKVGNREFARKQCKSTIRRGR